MNPNTKLVLFCVGGALLGALMGAGVVYWVQAQQIAQMEAAAQALQSEIDSTTAALDEVRAQLASATAAVPTTTPPAETPAETPTATRVRQFSFVEKVTGSASSAKVVADYAQLLVGDAANKEAAKRGDESPVPNDYYIVNDNPKLRTLPVKPGIKVLLTSNPDGTVDPAGYTVSLDTWIGYYAAPTDENEGIRAGAYWLNIENGVIVAVEQQYFP